MDIWHKLKGYEEKYEITLDGRVRSIRTGKILKPYKNPYGYIIITLPTRGKYKFSVGKPCLLHRLLMINFIENSENKPYVNHKNGVKDDNRIDNLEWCTAKENTQHARRILKLKSINFLTSKLNPEKVREIKKSLYEKVPKKDIASRFNVTRNTIYLIQRGKTWKDITIDTSI